ncbi:cyclin-domain-containing protein [Phakopsora pachyrhizi]|uniref:Cyclin-domain-containing protein n=1 Tax=Phakopsora pachyrhizi TaxID=170000 RepID=A0AAV0AMU2_PHAPC|nr:cyclin-domain-containing protein [Phakopsora pachyrhizi]
MSFHAKLVPQISIEAYLMRILKYCPTTNQVFLSAIVYLDRLSSRIRLKGHASANTDGKRHRHGFVVDSWNVHRYLIACLTASSKFLSDVFYTNSRYAKVGGLPLEELNELEVKFLLMNDFRMMIKLEEMVWYEERLITDRAIWDSENSTANSSKSDEEDFSEDYDDEEGEDYYEEDQDDGVNVRNTRDECCSSTSSNSERSSCSTVTPFCNTPTGSSSTILK